MITRAIRAVRLHRGACRAPTMSVLDVLMAHFLPTALTRVSITVDHVVIGTTHIVFLVTTTRARNATTDLICLETRAVHVPVMTQIVYCAIGAHAQNVRMDLFSAPSLQGCSHSINAAGNVVKASLIANNAIRKDGRV